MATGHVRDLWIAKRTGRRTDDYGKGQRWQANWTVNGQRRAQSFDRKIDAERHLAVTVTSQLRGDYVDPRAGRMTVKQFGEQWQQQRLRARPQTARRHRSTLERHVYPAMGNAPLGQVRRTTIQEFVAGLSAKGLAPSTVRMVYNTVLVALFNAAVRDQLIAASPCRDIHLPEAGHAEVTALTVAQVLALAEALPPWCAVLAELGAGSGLRPGEMLGLEVESIDFLRSRSVRVRQQLLTSRGEPYLGPTKTPSSVRTVPLADVTLARLARHLQEFPPVPVEVEDRTGGRPRRRQVRLLVTDGAASRLGRPLRLNRLSDAWRSAVAVVRESGVLQPALPEKVTPHVLRHTYASWLIGEGRPPKEIQARLGHKSITETFNTYGHLMEQAHEGTGRAIDAMFASGAER